MNLREKLEQAFESIKDGGVVVVNFEENASEASSVFNEFYAEHVQDGVRMRVNLNKKTISFSKMAVSKPAPAPTPTPAPEPVAEEPAPKPTTEGSTFSRFKSWSLDEKKEE